MKKEEQIEKYIELVLKENEKINLTGAKSFDEFKKRHVEDSLSTIKSFDFENKTIIDLGSGAGLPGIPLAIYFPNSKFILIEPIEKRVNFLNLVKDELGLKNVEILNIRMEDYSKDNKVDVIVSRAVSDLSILLELSIPFLKVGGTLIAYKGKKADEEIKKASNALNELNAVIDKVLTTNEGTINEGNNVFIKKIKETKNIYPRNYSKIKKNPL